MNIGLLGYGDVMGIYMSVCGVKTLRPVVFKIAIVCQFVRLGLSRYQ